MLQDGGIFWLNNNGDVYINGLNTSHALGITLYQDYIKMPTLFNYFKQKSLKVINASPSDEFTIVLYQDGSVWSAGCGQPIGVNCF